MNFRTLVNFVTCIFLVLTTMHSRILAENPLTSKFKVGVISPLSGPLAEYGLAAKNGIELAREQHPEKFKNIEIKFEDSQWLANKAVSAFNKLRAVNRVSLVLNWGNPTTEALAPLAEQYKLPLIGMTLDPSPSIGKRYVIRSTNSASQFSTKLAKHLRRKNYKKIGVVIVENTYVQGLYDGIRAEIGLAQNIEIISRYNHQDQDFRSSVTKIRARGYDAVGVFLLSGQVSVFYRQMSEQRISLPTFGTDFFESTTEIHNAGSSMNGAVYSHLGTTKQFKRDYLERYGNDYQIAYAGNWYDMAILIGSLFNGQSNRLSSGEIMKSLCESGEHNGVGGKFQFKETDKDGPYFQFPVQLKRIEGESIIVIE